MTKTELNTKWKKVINILCNDPNPSTRMKAQTWFASLSAFKINDEESVIYVINTDDNKLTRGITERNLSKISPAIAEVFGKEYSVVVKDDENEEPEATGSFTVEGADYFIEHYTFENFISGPNNRLALAVSLAIADGYSREYNPLFLYGGSGLGKTHLLHAIGHSVRENFPEKNVLYISSEQFTNEFIKSVRERTMENFREKYRKLDLLLFDDVQFIAGKTETETELFNTFDTLYNGGKQVVFVSDKPPKDLGDMPERLVSRFQMGMIADIQPPDYETRLAILTQKAEQENMVIDDDMKDVLDIIAQSIPNNIRELEGAFNRVVFQGTLTGEKLNKKLVKMVLTDVFNTKEKEITPDLIKKEVANYYGIKVSDLISSKRSREIAYPRQIAIYLVRNHTNLSLPKIGEEFGGRDHTTIMHSCDKINEELEKNKDLKSTVDNLTKHLFE